MRTLAAALLIATIGCGAGAAEKVIRIAVGGWTPGLGNPYASMITGTIHPYIAMFDALTFLAEDGTVEPRLALSWQADNQTTWTFKLRPGISFTNGEPMNADAVVAMVDWLKSEDGQRFFLASEVRHVGSVTAADPLTVVFKTKVPDVIFPRRMSLLQLTPPRYFKDIGADGFAQKALGTGPFALRTWGRDTGRSVWDAQPMSWRKAKHLTRYEFVVLIEAPRRTQALMLGEVDIAYGINMLDAEDLAAQGMRVEIGKVPTVGGLALPNNREGPLKDKRVRQAFSYAVDRETIGKSILHGAVKPSTHGLEPGVFGYDPELQSYPYDPAKAKALLTDAGYPDGISLTANVLASGITDGEAMYQRIAQDLRAAGIRVELRNVFGPDWVKMWFSGDWRGADIISHTWGGATYMDALRPLENIMCTKTGAYFCDPEIDAMIEASNLMFDPAEREKQLHAIIRKLHDLSPALFLFPQTDVMAFSPKVKNIVFRGRYLDWSELDIEP